MAIKKSGSISAIITNTAALVPMGTLVRKYTGIPIAPAMEKQISCLLVRLNATFVLTFDKSLGTDTNAMISGKPNEGFFQKSTPPAFLPSLQKFQILY